jgi:pyruvate/2-oxoglutarate dehydrogenase complex dihydrolipoamide dehydrogenase (E3) component
MFLGMKTALSGEKKYIEAEIGKRVERLKRKTCIDNADIAHLTDTEFMSLMLKQEDSMKMQLDKMVVSQGIAPNLETASRAHVQLTKELLAHAHEHSDTLFRIAMVSRANEHLLGKGAC